MFKFLNHYIHSQFIIFLELKNISVMKEHRRIKREMKMTLNRCLRSWLEFVAYQRNHKPISISVWIRIHYLEKSVCILCHYQFFINKSYHIIKEKNVISFKFNVNEKMCYNIRCHSTYSFYNFSLNIHNTSGDMFVIGTFYLWMYVLR